MQREGILYVLSAASGTGKTSVSKRLVDIYPALRHSVSFTTRPMRSGETDGVDYHFVTADRFKEMIEAGELAEWAQVHGNYYGTSLKTLEEARLKGQDLLLDIDIQGAQQIRKSVPAAVLIFLLPPSLDDLKVRLEGRGLDSAEVIERRLRNARSEIPAASWYDYWVVNASLDEAVADTAAILRAEGCRASRKLITVNDYFDL